MEAVFTWFTTHVQKGFKSKKFPMIMLIILGLIIMLEWKIIDDSADDLKIHHTAIDNIQNELAKQGEVNKKIDSLQLGLNDLNGKVDRLVFHLLPPTPPNGVSAAAPLQNVPNHIGQTYNIKVKP